MPNAVPPRDSRVLGLYLFDDGREERVEITLFEDGYFHEYVYYYKDEEGYSDTGTFFLDDEGEDIAFCYDDDISNWNYTAQWDAGRSTLIVDDYELEKDDRVPPKRNVDGSDQIPGVYELRYFDDEQVIIQLTLEESGRFVELCLYPDSNEKWIERGSFSYSIPSGYIAFEYDDWPEGDMSGILDARNGRLYAIEGDYIMIE